MNQVSRRRSGLHHAYVALVLVLGVAALVQSLHSLAVTPPPSAWIGLGLITVAAGAFTIKMPSLNAALSISETFLFITVLFFGPAPAVVVVALDGLTVSLLHRRRELRHAAFNLSEPALSMWVASAAFTSVSSVGPLWMGSHHSIGDVGVPALVLSGVYFLMNSGLNAIAVATESGGSPISIWRKLFLGVSMNYFGGGSIAVLVAVNMRSGELVSSLVAIAPLIVVSYFTFTTSMGRLEDENRHLADVNRLYLKMVETLALAVDAKDQLTHGHIRRVQAYARQLARRVGVTDSQVLQALEAAALLHDMGKLAIPEHVLNKPGKLTDDEYERMKQHAPIGADMLAAVGFPYPVVPVVRHHHENWDGSGYPDGLQGDAIPIGARVLAVVDCYDALRSHRPYRRSVSPDEAIAIIRERRGSMYDPTVVDAFQAIQATIESEDVGERPPTVFDRFSLAAHNVDVLARTSSALPIELRVAATDTLLRLYEQLSALDPAAGIDQTCDIVSRSLLRLAPAGLLVFYKRDDVADEVAAVYASGYMEAVVRDVRMRLGHGISGWVAANGHSVINADCALDLGHRIDGVEPQFRSVLSIPLGHPSGAVGVVTLYASQPQAFREEQRQAIDLIAGPVAEAFARALKVSADPIAAPAFALPPESRNGQTLSALLEQDHRTIGQPGRSLGVLCVENLGDARVGIHATAAVSRATRVADLIFRPNERSLVVLMPDCDAAAGQMVIERIAAALPPDVVPPPLESSPLRVAFACSPHDGESLRRLLDVAQRRLGGAPATPLVASLAAAAVAAPSAGGSS